MCRTNRDGQSMEGIMLKLTEEELVLLSLCVSNIIADMHELDYTPRMGSSKEEVVALSRRLIQECSRRGISRL